VETNKEATAWKTDVPFKEKAMFRYIDTYRYIVVFSNVFMVAFLIITRGITLYLL
jgi:hypothetical protein